MTDYMLDETQLPHGPPTVYENRKRLNELEERIEKLEAFISMIIQKESDRTSNSAYITKRKEQNQ